ncbi:F0F1 ATP synthase subunit A [Flavobacteriales bacterium]|nr:F0F1 ATP synthase subunit A [Flavobacteriales bacterium]
MLKNLILLFLLFTASVVMANEPQAHAENSTHNTAETKEESYDPVPVIMHHIADAHEWHFWGEGESSVSIPLPVILWTENGLVSFSASKFHHDDEGKVIVEAGDQKFVRAHGKIYYASQSENSHGGFVEHGGEEGHSVMNVKPLDFSITKNVAGIFLAMLIIFLIFTSVARSYKKNGGIPKKLTGWMEPLVLFVRDDIAKPNIGEKKYKKFLPFLLTVFFFIWVLNLLGLIPGGANVTGNIAVTLVLAVVTMVVVAINGNKAYWGHIFNPPVPGWLKPMMIPVEIIGIFTKPFALMIRLFANIAAGHIVILSLISLIFVAKTMWVAPASIALVLFISVLELLVAALQAYIFTLLTALFIGMAVEEHH